MDSEGTILTAEKSMEPISERRTWLYSPDFVFDRRLDTSADSWVRMRGDRSTDSDVQCAEATSVG